MKQLLEQVAKLLPIEKIPLNWDAMGYASQSFSKSACAESFTGWEGDLTTAEEVRVIAEQLEVVEGDRLLDIGCGYGRQDLLLARDYGLKVTGVDISPALIETARRLARNADLSITYDVKHGRDLNWQEEFDHCLIAFNTFSLFSPEDAPVVLHAVHRALRECGRLFLDLDNKPYNCRYGTSYRDWRVWPEGLLLQEVYFHRDSSVEVNRDVTLDPESNEVAEFLVFKRIYAEEDIRSLMSDCGFQVAKLHGSWHLSPLDDKSPKIILLARRE
jgi:cyclopropane fatty-acyl-phospholipid synthase-like methyltransferase